MELPTLSLKSTVKFPCLLTLRFTISIFKLSKLLVNYGLAISDAKPYSIYSVFPIILNPAKKYYVNKEVE